MSERDQGQIADTVETAVKGPDAAVWGNDEDRPQATDEGLAIGEIRNEGEPNERKGPGPAWETDDQGNYVNR
jgi:hypothetical protein